jgi:hypothetical protein
MNGNSFVWSYLQMCGTGKLPLSDCGPVWQIGIIAVILTSAIALLIVLRIQTYAKSTGRE